MTPWAKPSAVPVTPMAAARIARAAKMAVIFIVGAGSCTKAFEDWSDLDEELKQTGRDGRLI